MNMTQAQYNKCRAIIHSAAGAAGAGNLVPVPGTGAAADLLAMTAMTASLAGVFGSNVNEQVARGMAIAALKQSLLKQPIKVLGKELAKLVPGLGQMVAPAISITLIEAAGWAIANDLAMQHQRRLSA